MMALNPDIQKQDPHVRPWGVEVMQEVVHSDMDCIIKLKQSHHYTHLRWDVNSEKSELGQLLGE